MVLDYHTLMAMAPIEMEQSYTGRDSCLYALGVGCGMDPADGWLRQYLSPLPPARVLPTMASVLAAPRVHSMNLGVTMSGVLHGAQSLVSHAALPPEGRVRSDTRIVGLFDRGEGRGCQLDIARELKDALTGVHYATALMKLVCRADQVKGAPPADPLLVPEERRGNPDEVLAVPTSAQAAQIFCLLGDQNPLHLLPDAAAKAGFPKPVLHGLATYGLCAAFVEKALCTRAGERPTQRLGAIAGKFSAPVYPGETVEIALWYEPRGARIEARVAARDKVVFAEGQVVLEKLLAWI